jgi:hypothetical protein
MDTNAIVAIIGGAVVAFIIRVFNVVVEWLARVLGVEPPAPIPTDADRPPQGTTGANPGTSGPTTG